MLLRNEPVRVPPGPGEAGARGAARAARAAAAAQPVLPLVAAELKRLAVIGRLAAVPNTGDHGSSGVNPPTWSRPWRACGRRWNPWECEVLYDDGVRPGPRRRPGGRRRRGRWWWWATTIDDEGERPGRRPAAAGCCAASPCPRPWALPSAVAMAARGAWQLLPAGFAKGGDRKSLTLHAHDEDLLLAVAAANPRTVAVVMCGSAVLMERWRAGGAGHPDPVVSGHGGRSRPGRHRPGQGEAHRPPALRHPHQRASTCPPSTPRPRWWSTALCTARPCSTTWGWRRRSRTGSGSGTSRHGDLSAERRPQRGQGASRSVQPPRLVALFRPKADTRPTPRRRECRRYPWLRRRRYNVVT